MQELDNVRNAMHIVDQTWIDSLTWRAVYKDGKALYERLSDGRKNRYENIDRYRLIRFDILDQDRQRVLSVFPSSERQLVFRRRRFFHGAPGQDNPLTWTVILVGWHQLVSLKTPDGQHASKSIKSIAYIYPNKAIDFDDARSDLIIREQEIE